MLLGRPLVGRSVLATVTPRVGLLLFVAALRAPGVLATVRVASLLDIQSSILAPAQRLPYLASIRRPGNHEHVCTGVLVHPSYVLTAAHCVEPTSLYSAGYRGIVHIGGDSVDQRGASVEVQIVERTIFHEKWSPEEQQRSPYNIALLKLPQASSHPVPMLLLDHFNVQSGQMFMAAGWGPGGDGPALGDEIFGGLRLEPQEFICAHHCNKTILWNGSICEDLACALNKERAASCVVDSGSPLLLLDTPGYDIASGTPTLDFLIGVNVDGAPCGTAGKPDVFVDVRAHGEWLQRHLNGGA